MIKEHSLVLGLAGDVAFDDFDGLYEHLLCAFAYMNGRIDPPSSMHKLTPALLQAKAAAEYLVLAWCDKRLVGCVFIKPGNKPAGNWYLGKLAVGQQMRGQGVGQALLARAETLCASNGGLGIELEVRVELTENHAFFEKCGYIRCGENAHKGYDRATSFLYRKPVQ